jgi:hypothetical protein
MPRNDIHAMFGASPSATASADSLQRRRERINLLEDLLREVLAPSAIACSGEALESLRGRIRAAGIEKRT